MDHSVTKQAYARGIGEYLQRVGALQVPSEPLLKQACDAASYLITTEPAYYGVLDDDATKVANALIQFNDDLQRQGKTAADPSAISLGRDVRVAIGDLIEKTAAAVMDSPHLDLAANTTSTITGTRTDQGNLLADSVQAEAKLDAHRPEGYAVVGQGNTNFSEPQAARVGIEQPHPLAPTGVGGASSNSVMQASKAAAVALRLRKLAMGEAPPYGSTIVGGDANQGNLNADSYNAEAMMDIADRPENYGLVGQGNAGIQDIPTSAEVGSESVQPNAPTPPGGAPSNSVTQATAKSARWQRHFEETAREIEPRLPSQMPMDQKVAAIKRAMSMEPSEQYVFLEKIAHEYGQARDTVGNVLGSLGMLSRG